MNPLVKKLKSAWLGIALLLAFTTPALAGGTAPDVLISNTATLAYKIGIVQQDPLSDTVDFKVDRLVDYSLSNNGEQTVAPNSTVQTLSFTIQNDGNDTYNFDVSLSQTAGTFTVGALQLVDAGGNPVANTGNLAPDASITLYAKGTVPSDAANAQTATITLSVDAVKNTGGVAVTNDNAADDTALGVETAWAAVTSTSSANYKIGAAVLSITKGYVIVSDPTGAVAPKAKAIPGATVEYTLTITNGPGAETAVDVTLTDDAPANTSYSAGTTTIDTGSGPTPIADVAGACPLAAGYNIGDVAAGETVTVKFRATID